MSPADLRLELVRESQELATWEFSLADAKRCLIRPFAEHYDETGGRSVAERVKYAEGMTIIERERITEAEGHVNYHRALCACLFELLRTPMET